MFCKNCGAKLEDGYKFCPNCNSPVGVEASSSQLTQKTVQPNTKKKKLNKKVIIIVCISVFVFLSGFVGLCILFGDELDDLDNYTFDSVTTEKEIDNITTTVKATEAIKEKEIYAKDYLGMNNKLILEKLGKTYTLGGYDGGACCYVLDNVPEFKFVYPPDDWDDLDVEEDKVFLFIDLNKGGKIDSHFNRDMTYNELKSEISKMGTDVTVAEGTGGDWCDGPDLLYYLNVSTADYYIHYQWDNVSTPTENPADSVTVSAPSIETFNGYVNFNDEFCGNWSDHNRTWMDIYYDGENYRIRFYGSNSAFESESDEIIGTYDKTGDTVKFEKSKRTTTTYDMEGNNPNPTVITKDVDMKGYLKFNSEGLMMYSDLGDRLFYKEY